VLFDVFIYSWDVQLKRTLIAWAGVIPALLPIILVQRNLPAFWFHHRVLITTIYLLLIGIGTVYQSLVLTNPSFSLLAGFTIWQYNVELVPLRINFFISLGCTLAYLGGIAQAKLPISTLGWHAAFLITFLVGLLPPAFRSGCVGRKITNISSGMEREHRMLSKEEKRGTALLHSLLPKMVVTRIQSGATLIADSYANVSVLFTDMKGFTSFSSSVTPSELVAFLNQMFSRFDAISAEHDIYKVEIIGDAYYAVAGCPDYKANHAEEACITCIKFLWELPAIREKCGDAIDIRIGIHTGPVVAGVVGLKDPRYHLFGDTVNYANDMESHGVPSRVHISEATYLQIQNNTNFVFEDRGNIEVKGRGQQHTYFVDFSTEFAAKVLYSQQQAGTGGSPKSRGGRRMSAKEAEQVGIDDKFGSADSNRRRLSVADVRKQRLALGDSERGALEGQLGLGELSSSQRDGGRSCFPCCRPQQQIAESSCGSAHGFGDLEEAKPEVVRVELPAISRPLPSKTDSYYLRNPQSARGSPKQPGSRIGSGLNPNPTLLAPVLNSTPPGTPTKTSKSGSITKVSPKSQIAGLSARMSPRAKMSPRASADGANNGEFSDLLRKLTALKNGGSVAPGVIDNAIQILSQSTGLQAVPVQNVGNMRNVQSLADRRSNTSRQGTKIAALLDALTGADDSGGASLIPISNLRKLRSFHRMSTDAAAAKWNLDVFALATLTDHSPLQFFANPLFDSYKFDELGVNRSLRFAFFDMIETGYDRNHPYHNSSHATSVANDMHYFLQEGGLKTMTEPWEQLALLFSAIIHDYKHPATNNNFEIVTLSDRALTYNNYSVLENFHVAEAFKVAQVRAFAN
jgi:class 3 adenylate cyclase